MINTRIIAIVMFLLLFCKNSFCSPNYFSNYNVKLLDNLPQSEINDIIQDQNGFIWIATLDGLYRYNGYDYKCYQINNTSNSISSNMILKLKEDSKGNILIGTYGRGLCILNPKTDKFTNYLPSKLVRSKLAMDDVTALEVDKNDNIWIGNTYGIIHIQLNKDSSYKNCLFFPRSKSDKKNNYYISCIHKDANNHIWIGYNHYLRRISLCNKKVIIKSEFHIDCNEIANYKNGIIVGGNQISYINYNNKSNNYSAPKTLYNESAYNLLTRGKDIWFGNRQGVKKLSLNNNNYWEEKLYLHKDILPFKFNSNVVSCIINTRSNQLWIGTRGGGAIYIKEKEKKFYNYSPSINNGILSNLLTRSVFEDSKKNLWIGDEENGVFFLKDGYNYNDNYKNIHVNVSNNDRGYAFEETFTQNFNKYNSVIWVGTCYPKCLTSINPETLSEIPQKKSSPENIGFVFALKKTDENTLWVGTYNHGLWRLTLDNEGQIIKSKQFVTFTTNISSNIIRSIFQDSKGDLWIGTDMGANIISKKDLKKNNPTFIHLINKNINLSDCYILQIAESKNGNILMGTMGKGLIIYRRKEHKISFITKENGLENNSVKSIVEDPKNGHLWLSTNRGLSQYNTNSGQIINYRKGSGLSESEFSEICGIRRKDGTFIFGSRSGFVTFKPEGIKKDLSKPKVFITNIFLNNRSIENSDAYSEINNSPEFLKNIELKYNDHNIVVEFAGIEYASPEEIKYAYKLDGFDKEWHYVYDDQRKATYTNLPEGKYIFKLKAANSDGVWNDVAKELKIKINPPFSRSGIAYLLYLLLFIAILFVTYIIIKAFYLKKKELYSVQMEKQKDDEINLYRFQFFTNLSHEFRTPLTLINIPLESLMGRANKSNDIQSKNDLSVIKQNSDILMRLINQLLDFRKIERGKEKLNLLPTDINNYFNMFYNLFLPLAQKQNIDFIFKPCQETIISDIDKEMFEKVMFNILSNAFKYTPSNGKIVLGIENQDSQVMIYLKDSGNGIPENELPYIFDRFHQVKEKSYIQQNGSGIGLNLSKSIVELHKGVINIDSKLGEGTTCRIILNKSTTNAIDNSNEYKIKTELNVDEFLIDESYSINNDNNIENLPKENLPSILIVEDNNELRNQLAQHLKNEFNVYTAENGSLGYKEALDKYPQLIITDIKMPIMDGITMCNKIKANEEISHIPIIVLTANNTLDNHINSFNIGYADSFIEKPFNMEVLKSNILSILKNRAILQNKFRSSSIINPEDIAHNKTDLKFMTEIINIIKKNMGNSELSIEMIAQEYGVSRTYLNRKIKAMSGETSNQFLRNIRLKYAAKLILQKQLNITEIAWEVGYNDINTFRQRFKEKFGVPPTSYKNDKKENLD